MTQVMLLLYRVRFDDIQPMLDLQKALRESALMMFLEKKAAPEGLMQKKEEPKLEIKKTRGSIGPKVGDKAKLEESETYTISYYNPNLDRYEVLESTTTIVMDDTVKKKIEETTGVQNVYPLYSFIVTPIMLKEINPYILKEILENREYGTPPPSGGATAMRIRVTEAEPAKIGEAKGAIEEAIRRKESAEDRIAAEIIILEQAIDRIKKGGDIRGSVRELGPLTRARFLAALRKKGISKEVLLLLLIRDVDFLKSIKKKLETLTVDGLIELVKAMGMIQKIK